jgi:hypothetical protein
VQNRFYGRKISVGSGSGEHSKCIYFFFNLSEHAGRGDTNLLRRRRFKVIVKTINYQFHNLRNTAPSIYGHRFCRLTKPLPPPPRRYCSFNLIPFNQYHTMRLECLQYTYIHFFCFSLSLSFLCPYLHARLTHPLTHYLSLSLSFSLTLVSSCSCNLHPSPQLHTRKRTRTHTRIRAHNRGFSRQ